MFPGRRETGGRGHRGIALRSIPRPPLPATGLEAESTATAEAAGTRIATTTASPIATTTRKFGATTRTTGRAVPVATEPDGGIGPRGALLSPPPLCRGLLFSYECCWSLVCSRFAVVFHSIVARCRSSSRRSLVLQSSFNRNFSRSSFLAFGDEMVASFQNGGRVKCSKLCIRLTTFVELD